MKRYMVGYCWNCAEKTKQKVIECEDSIAVRAFETIFTLGFGAMIPRNYECECIHCGYINTINK